MPLRTVPTHTSYSILPLLLSLISRQSWLGIVGGQVEWSCGRPPCLPNPAQTQVALLQQLHLLWTNPFFLCRKCPGFLETWVRARHMQSSRDLKESLFYDSVFHCLSRCGNVWVCHQAPYSDQDDAEVHMHTELLQGGTTVSTGPEGDLAAMYLVQSRDELLMVHRLTQLDGHTFWFRVFCMIELVCGGMPTGIYAWQK